MLQLIVYYLDTDNVGQMFLVYVVCICMGLGTQVDEYSIPSARCPEIEHYWGIIVKHNYAYLVS